MLTEAGDVVTGETGVCCWGDERSCRASLGELPLGSNRLRQDFTGRGIPRKRRIQLKRIYRNDLAESRKGLRALAPSR